MNEVANSLCISHGIIFYFGGVLNVLFFFARRERRGEIQSFISANFAFSAWNQRI